jgi:tetratricopeptide (TPR) repeat protein
MAVGLIFALIGYLGFKSIGKMKDDYSAELQNVRELRGNLELELESLRRKQENTQRQVESLKEKQEGKIKLLEITEKASAVFNSRNYDWALEHIKVGLEVNAEYPPLIRLLALCYMKLLRYPEAISAYKKLLLLEPNNHADIQNYAELLVLSKNLENFEEFYTSNKTIIDGAHNGALTAFLNTLAALQKEDLAGSKQAMQSLISTSQPGLSQRMLGWQYDDTASAISKMPPGELKDYANKVVGFFSGSITTEDMAAG